MLRPGEESRRAAINALIADGMPDTSGPFGDGGDQLLGEQRIPARSAPDAVRDIGAQPPLTAEGQHQRMRRALVERAEWQRGEGAYATTPGRAALQQLRARLGNDQQRSLLGTRSDGLDQVQ